MCKKEAELGHRIRRFGYRRCLESARSTVVRPAKGQSWRTPSPRSSWPGSTRADRAALAQRGRQRRWPAGASLFLEGEPADA